jgi:hypothetical protein
VLLGRLGADALNGATAAPETPRAGCRFFAETQLNVCGAFLQTWRRYGLDLHQSGMTEAENLALFGLPLTPPQPETLSDGQTYTVQWFERARFEDHGAQGVMLGLLGREQAQPPAPAAPSLTEASAGGFIRVSGNQLTLNGQPVLIKGANYYPQWRPWLDMWTKWDGPQVERELKQGHDDLGLNTVRVLVPYLTKKDGTVEPALLRRLQETVQIAGRLNMRVIVSLFDADQDFPAPGSALEAQQATYLRTLLEPFVADDRVIAWNIHNEPDQYDIWRGGGAQVVLQWLGRMADIIHQIDPNHLVTVAPATYDALWLPGPDGRRMIDYSDVVSWHNYNADDAARQFAEIRQRTGKPILLEEFGWPTGPACYARGFNETEQERVYRTMIQATQGQVVGFVAWNLRDWDSGPTSRWDTDGDYYGLYRADGSLKPAAAVFRAYAAGPLPSAATSNLPLTSDKPGPFGGLYGALLIPESGHYVKLQFRRAWRLFGEQGSFGLPLTEAYVRPSDGVVVQYFEHAVLEYHPEAAAKYPNFALLPEAQQIQILIRPVAIGSAFTSSRGYGPGDHDLKGPFKTWYDQYYGSWRLGRTLSAQMTEDVNGTPTTVQYFERGRLELNPATGTVGPSALGTWSFDQQCQSVQ